MSILKWLQTPSKAKQEEAHRQQLQQNLQAQKNQQQAGAIHSAATQMATSFSSSLYSHTIASPADISTEEYEELTLLEKDLFDENKRLRLNAFREFSFITREFIINDFEQSSIVDKLSIIGPMSVRHQELKSKKDRFNYSSMLFYPPSFGDVSVSKPSPYKTLLVNSGISLEELRREHATAILEESL